MDRTERIYKIKSMLQGGAAVRIERFLAALEVSKPTFRRDLEYMRDRLNYPIVWDRERRGYRVEEAGAGRHELPGLWLSSSEAHVLLTMHYLLGSLPPERSRPPAKRSDDDCFPLHSFEIRFPKADYTRADVVGNADIDYQDIVLLVMNELVQHGHQVGMTAFVQSALEYGELQPLAMSIHQLIHCAPALRIADIVGNKVKMIIHCSTW